MSKCGEKVKLVCVESRKKLSPLHMSSSELPHMMLLREEDEEEEDETYKSLFFKSTGSE